MAYARKQKRPFYRRWWFWLIIFLLFIGVMANYQQNGTQGTHPNTASKTAAHKTEITREQYNQIAMGQDQDTVKKTLGKANATSETDVNGQKAVVWTWSKLDHAFKAGSISVTFVDGKVESKGYLNLAVKQLKPVSQATYDSIQSGATYDEVIQKIGRQPDSESVTTLGEATGKTISYLTDKNGKAQTFVFSADRLVSKTQTQLKQ
ncbi:DUF3862 domain-containing protein [Fructilactobacillus cliffordii]|uniref:DUF3862 domain-containing protein n=1 Tax=Fructilactobacillus cliffordii TaxID=2940299 RepID=UPI0020935656|nr:DUF3862 domain-containing protein [Fructilactobacillus cliffordii]USS85925.1 DUF3862 domain-containing protein [Fructilactobacillus cliffordii]